jgi:hypothetical protein
VGDRVISRLQGGKDIGVARPAVQAQETLPLTVFIGDTSIIRPSVVEKPA